MFSRVYDSLEEEGRSTTSTYLAVKDDDHDVLCGKDPLHPGRKLSLGNCSSPMKCRYRHHSRNMSTVLRRTSITYYHHGPRKNRDDFTQSSLHLAGATGTCDHLVNAFFF